MAIYDKKSGKRINPATQINTSTSHCIKNGLDYSGGAVNPVYPKSDTPIDVYRDSDYLFKDFDPVLNERLKSEQLTSKENAESINPILTGIE